VLRSVIFFDLDDTLYPSSCGLWNAIRDRIDKYIHLKLNIPESQISSLRQNLFQNYGTTLRGLQKEYAIETSEYLEFVHNVEVSAYISADATMIQAFKDLEFRKLIFTNADKAHARRILGELRIEPFIESIIDIGEIAPYCKPQMESFRIALRSAKAAPSECILVDDSIPNLLTAQHASILPVLISDGQPNSNGFYQIKSVTELPALLKSLQ
jgi:putative hydrolase of the HAD superfamily